VKQRGALWPFLLKFALGYAIGNSQVSQNGMDFNGSRQLLFCYDDVNILDSRVKEDEMSGKVARMRGM
jgi:hypothetical protein